MAVYVTKIASKKISFSNHHHQQKQQKHHRSPIPNALFCLSLVRARILFVTERENAARLLCKLNLWASISLFFRSPKGLALKKKRKNTHFSKRKSNVFSGRDVSGKRTSFRAESALLTTQIITGIFCSINYTTRHIGVLITYITKHPYSCESSLPLEAYRASFLLAF